jgi:hypothetical protein
MYVVNEVNDETVRKAILIVLKNFTEEEFLNSLVGVRFNHTTDTGGDVVVSTLRFKQTVPLITIKPYKTFLSWSKVIGYADSKKLIIYINTRKLDLPLKDRVMNIRHEIFHLQGYHHRGNRADAYNLMTVPYLGAALFVKWLENNGRLQ